MGVDVVVLGSGSPLPDQERAGPALAVAGEAGWMLVDCGRAVGNAGAAAVGGLAAELQPGILVLTHLIPAPRSVEHRQRYLGEVRAGGFAGSTLVAHDGLRITVAKY
jgi:ribonuclease BN (tRNA processing enzyme)